MEDSGCTAAKGVVASARRGPEGPDGGSLEEEVLWDGEDRRAQSNMKLIDCVNGDIRQDEICHYSFWLLLDT